MAVIMLAQFLTVCEIFARQEKSENFNFDNEVQDQGVDERDVRLSAGNV